MPKRMTAYEHSMAAERIVTEAIERRRIGAITVEEALLEAQFAKVHAILATAGDLRS